MQTRKDRRQEMQMSAIVESQKRNLGRSRAVGFRMPVCGGLAGTETFAPMCRDSGHVPDEGRWCSPEPAVPEGTDVEPVGGEPAPTVARGALVG